MDIPNELWYTVFSFLTQKSMSKFSCLLNLHNLSTKEIKLTHRSNDLWFNAARKGYTKLIKLLIKYGDVDVNKQDNRGYTALHLASLYGYKDCVELLIKSGGNLNKQCNNDWTALHWASRYGYKDCVELLIKSGADLNKQDIYGYTSLHEASRNGHKECVKLLIKANGININKKDNDGDTALHKASKFGHKDCLELLVKAGTTNYLY